jgi:hypothetical protein
VVLCVQCVCVHVCVCVCVCVCVLCVRTSARGLVSVLVSREALAPTFALGEALALRLLCTDEPSRRPASAREEAWAV